MSNGLYFSVSTIESFRRMKAAFIRKIKGEYDPPGDKAQLGTAFHLLCQEGIGKYLLPGGRTKVPADGRGILSDIEFSQEESKVALDYFTQVAGSRFEFKAYPVFDMKGFGLVKLGMRVDVLRGATVRDIKVTHRKPDLQDYIDSLQWKVYLEALQANRFVYDLFEVKDLKRGREIIPYEPLECYPYPGMRADIEEAILAVLDYCEKRNLLSFLESKYPVKK